jgi:glycosyltransferase involved in cell wall biosynthesis
VKVAIVHDYLTQRGGAERVVLALREAFPDAVIHTSLYDPDGTFDAFRSAPIVCSRLNRLRFFRRHHRWAFPFLPFVFGAMRVDADIAVCSSSGWAHSARVTGTKVVYCHTPARWLYAPGRAFAERRNFLVRLVLGTLARPLATWDRRGAASAAVYLANSTWTAREVERIYGRAARVLPPPPGVDDKGLREEPAGVDRPFLLCVARLVRYKNVDAVVEAFEQLPDVGLVVVGDGPEAARLRAIAGPNVRFLSHVSDEQLRWLYASCEGLVAGSYEDFGLTPVEAASFGRPTAALRFGGYLDTVIDGETGVFFERPEPSSIADAVRVLRTRRWGQTALRVHAARFGKEQFIDSTRTIVNQAMPAEM